MARRIAWMLMGWGMLAAASGVLMPAASGAEWYPFYGYHRPSYLGQPCVVYAQPAAVVTVEPAAPGGTVQPAATQGSTGYYVPAAVTTPAQRVWLRSNPLPPSPISTSISTEIMAAVGIHSMATAGPLIWIGSGAPRRPVCESTVLEGSGSNS